jgi:nucleotide-binding universal stress UspA family protein
MKKILVPVDGSSNSLRAVKFALEEAKHAPVSIHLLHVMAAFDDYGMMRAYISKPQGDRLMKARAADILKRVAAPLRKAKVDFETHIAGGDTEVASRIVDAARRLRCNSIVMGTRGMGSLGNLVLGSVATKVIHATRIPVTLIK